MYSFSLSRRRGFTLIEMVVYTAILGIIAVLAINSTLAMTRAFTSLRVSRDINSSATALFERLTRDIRGAYGVDLAQSDLGSNPGRLTLNTKDGGGSNTTIEFYVDNGLIKILKPLSPMILWKNPQSGEEMCILLIHYKAKLLNKKDLKPVAPIKEVLWLSISDIKEGKYNVAPNITYLIEKGEIK